MAAASITESLTRVLSRLRFRTYAACSAAVIAVTVTTVPADRPARSAAEALRELWRCSGTQFDAEVVRALASALPAVEVAPPEGVHTLAIAAPRLAAVSGGRA